MKSIDELRTIVDREILGLKYPNAPNNLYSPIEYILSLGGKRMRPILFLLAHQLFDKDLSKAIKPSLAIEVFHNFTLLHDDIMDKAPVRRGKGTVHTKWNENVAILSGDAMLIQSYQYLCELPQKKMSQCLNIFNKMAIQVCEGQQYDMDFEIQAEVDMNSYLKMIEYKTAVLLGASLKMGAIVGGGQRKQSESLYEFGRNIGIAFQLKDDLLDIFGDMQSFGKQVGGDIIANKKTCLYIKAISLLEGESKMRLVNLYNSEDSDDREKIELVKSIFNSLDVQSHINKLIEDYYKKAIEHLNCIDCDLSQLQEFASILKERRN